MLCVTVQYACNRRACVYHSYGNFNFRTASGGICIAAPATATSRHEKAVCLFVVQDKKVSLAGCCHTTQHTILFPKWKASQEALYMNLR